MRIAVGSNDKLLITKSPIHRAAADYKGGETCGDIDDCWLRFRKSRTGDRRCFISTGILPDKTTTKLPRYIVTHTKDKSLKPTVHLPVLNPENEGKIPIGRFPRGDLASIRIVMPDQEFVELKDSRAQGFLEGQQVLDVSTSNGLRIFARRLLDRVNEWDIR